MSTRCNIKIIDNTKKRKTENYLYQHYDGYPSGVGSYLTTDIIPGFIIKNIMDHPFMESLYSYIINYDNSYESTDNINTDIDYLYTLEVNYDNISHKYSVHYICDSANIVGHNGSTTIEFEKIEDIIFYADMTNSDNIIIKKDVIMSDTDKDRDYHSLYTKYFFNNQKDTINKDKDIVSEDKDIVSENNINIIDSTYITIRDSVINNVMSIYNNVDNNTLKTLLINLCDTIYNYKNN